MLPERHKSANKYADESEKGRPYSKNGSICIDQEAKASQNTKEADRCDGRTDKKKEAKMTAYECWSLFATLAGVTVGIVVLIVYALQLSEMRKATNAAKDAAQSAKYSADAAMAGQRAYVATQAYGVSVVPLSTLTLG
jgi:hypothetical protein